MQCLVNHSIGSFFHDQRTVLCVTFFSLIRQGSPLRLEADQCLSASVSNVMPSLLVSAV